MTDSIHIDPAEPTPRAQLDHCVVHPDQTVENCESGFGLAGGGFGPYYICGKCGLVFGKITVDD